MLSPMRLERFWLEELVIETALHDNSKAAEHQSYDIKHIDFDVKKKRESNTLRLRLLVEIVALENPRLHGVKRVRIALWGQFSFAEGAAEDFIQNATPLNQLAILYGLARGIVANTTGSAIAGTFLLPSVDFHAVVTEKIQRVQQEAGIAPAEPASLPDAPDASKKRRQMKKLRADDAA